MRRNKSREVHTPVTRVVSGHHLARLEERLQELMMLLLSHAFQG